MKSYKNIEQINKEWSQFGFRLNEKGEIWGTYEGKEYKVGTWKVENKQERERETKNKLKK